MSVYLQSLPQGLLDVVGVAGFATYVLNYMLQSFYRPWLDTVAYYVTNVAAASMVLVGLSSSFNLASAMIQIFWIGISALAIVIRLRRPTQADGV